MFCIKDRGYFRGTQAEVDWFDAEANPVEEAPNNQGIYVYDNVFLYQHQKLPFRERTIRPYDDLTMLPLPPFPTLEQLFENPRIPFRLTVPFDPVEITRADVSEQGIDLGCVFIGYEFEYSCCSDCDGDGWISCDTPPPVGAMLTGLVQIDHNNLDLITSEGNYLINFRGNLTFSREPPSPIPTVADAGDRRTAEIIPLSLRRHVPPAAR